MHLPVFGEKRRRIMNPFHTKKEEKDELIELKKDQFQHEHVTSPPSLNTPNLKVKRHINKSMTMRAEKELMENKSNNLNLSDYLKLYSMSKRSQRSLSKESRKQQPLFHAGPAKHLKSENAIDAVQSIKVVRDETKKQIKIAGRNLNRFLQKIDSCDQIKEDEESLVFMCNVLHIFEEKIMMSVKIAQQLVEDRRREKINKLLKEYSHEGVQKTRRNRLNLNRSRSVLEN